MNVFDIIVKYRQGFVDGLEVTLALASITWSIGLTLGPVLGALGHRWKRLLGTPLRVVGFVLSGIPLLVFLYWVHYPLQVLLEVVVDPFYSALAVLAVLNVVGVAEICRAALDNFPGEYVLAAKVCGLTPADTFRYVQLPLILRQVIPSLLTLQVTVLQMTLFASLISVEELFRVAQRINSSAHKPVEIYSALAVFFLMICLPVNGVALFLRARFTRDVSER